MGQLIGKSSLEAGRLRREKRRQRVPGRLGHGGVEGDIALGPREAHVAGCTPVDRVDRLEYRDVDDRHGARGAAGSHLFPEDARLSFLDGRVVEATCVDGDLIPAVDDIQVLRAANFIGRGIDSGLGEGGRRLRAAEEEIAQEIDAVADVDKARIVGVGGIETGGVRRAEKEGSKNADRIGELQAAGHVRVAAHKGLGPERWSKPCGCQKDQQN